MGHTEPLDYMLSSSHISLESYELLRLNRASNLRKIFLQLLEEWVDTEKEARLAREVLEWKRTEVRPEDRDEFLNYEPLPHMILSRDLRKGARCLCATPEERSMTTESHSDTPARQFGLAFCLGRSLQKYTGEWKPLGTASLVLRRLERT